VHAFGAIGGAPHLLVPDNTKAAVVKVCLYDLLVNRTYADMAAHYDTAILPARPRRPRDKAKVERAVLIVNLDRPFLGVFAVKEGLVDILLFSPHLGSPGTRFGVREGRQIVCARAVELRRKGSKDGVKKSAPDRTW
jgi:hypothetical protein